ncbi:MAG TPA: addiction module antidote protein, HigA family [Advenella kashmirensis]|uniref:Addiction module antidote protein, HigA family n=1 Tax=Advenella kashmirensis TaxID=310575 RepID=A0A356LJ43_9BURK|nr:addiction module antidote protein, HigA family [Advenella kashmirensis]
MMKNHPHPGELLKANIIETSGVYVTEAAARLGVSRTTLSRLLNGRIGVSPDMALRLEKAGLSNARFWMDLQTNYELSKVDLKNLNHVRSLISK